MRLRGQVAEILAAACFALALAGAAEAPSQAGGRDDAWVAAMQARRAGLQSGQDVRETSWYEAAPMKAASMSEALSPERGVDLDKRGGRRRAWQPKLYPNGIVNQVKTKPQTTTYLYRTLAATVAEPIQLRLGTSGGLALWVNGEKLLSKDVARTAAPDQETVKAALRAGTNTVLLKLHTAAANPAFYYNTDHSVAGALAPVARKFPAETKLLAKHATAEGWLENPNKTAIEEAAIERLLQRLHATAERLQLDALKKEAASPKDPRWLKLLLTLARQADAFQQAKEDLQKPDPAALGRAIEDLSATYPGKYRDGPVMLQQLKAFEQHAPALAKGLENCDKDAMARYLAMVALRQKALLSNPLLDFEQMLDDYRPCPYRAQPACAGVGAGARKTVRGGSWSDRPKESRASARWDYPRWQRVYNVGLRIAAVE